MCGSSRDGKMGRDLDTYDLGRPPGVASLVGFKGASFDFMAAVFLTGTG